MSYIFKKYMTGGLLPQHFCVDCSIDALHDIYKYSSIYSSNDVLQGSPSVLLYSDSQDVCQVPI